MSLLPNLKTLVFRDEMKEMLIKDQIIIYVGVSLYWK